MRGARRPIGSVLGGSFLVLGRARPLTLTLGTACYTLIHLHCVSVHLHLDVAVNEHIESALAEDVMDDEVAGPRSLLTAAARRPAAAVLAADVVPLDTWASWAPSAAAPDERAAAE